MIEFFQDFNNLIEITLQVELAILLFSVSVLGILFRILKQPLVLAYLTAGVLISLFGIFNLEDGRVVEVFSSMGIMFLLFLVGMEMDYRSIKRIGLLSLIIGTGQVIFTTFGGFLFGYYLFGFDFLSSLYIGIALAFSSTVIIIKILSDKGSLSTLHGRVAMGLLLVQDIIVIFILIALNTVEAGGTLSTFYFIKILLLAVLFFGVMLFLGRAVFPYLFHKIARSQELLFLVSLGWLFVFAAVIEQFGFSIEIAGFLGGVALANSSEKYHIASKVRPLRDFFIVIFFVYMGSLMIISHFNNMIVPIVVLSIFVLIGKPLIVMALMGLMRYKKRTGFLTGATAAQISEFSLVFVVLGFSLGHISEEVFALVVAVGVLTIGASTYIIIYSEKIFPYLSPFLSFFERKKTYEEEGDFGISKEVVLIGAQRIGKRIINYIHKDNLLVVDFDPLAVDYLERLGFNHIFGDIKDPHLFEEINLEKTKLVISTSPQFEDNLFLLKKIKDINKKIKVVVRSQNKEDALYLYENKADYVFLPHFLSGEYLGKIIDKELELKDLDVQRKKDIKILKTTHER
jgi:Kef-type K+ transport system membrane component KefB